MWLSWQSVCLACPRTWAPASYQLSRVWRMVHLPLQYMGGRCRRFRSSRQVSVSCRVWGQPGLREILSQKRRKKDFTKCSSIVIHVALILPLEYVSFMKVRLRPFCCVLWVILCLVCTALILVLSLLSIIIIYVFKSLPLILQYLKVAFRTEPVGELFLFPNSAFYCQNPGKTISYHTSLLMGNSLSLSVGS